MAKKEHSALIVRYADMLSAMGSEPRLRIVRLLLSAHPEGMVVGEVIGFSKAPMQVQHLRRRMTQKSSFFNIP
jgi:hypothetical protein